MITLTYLYSTKSENDGEKLTDTSQKRPSTFGRGRGLQNGEKRGFGRFNTPRGLENQENVDGEDRKRTGFGSGFANKPETSEKDEVRRFGSGFPESRTFRGRGFSGGAGGGKRGFKRPPRGNFNRGGFSRPPQDGAETFDEPQNSEDTPVKAELSTGEIGHWENEGETDGGNRSEYRGGNRGRSNFARRGRGRGRGGGSFGSTRRDFNRPPQEGGRGGGKVVEKREGSGSNNWGTMMDDLESVLHSLVPLLLTNLIHLLTVFK